MGASLTFLDKPITDIEYATGHSDALKTKFVAAEMQGWRLNMVSNYYIILNLCLRLANYRKMHIFQISISPNSRRSSPYSMVMEVVKWPNIVRKIIRKFYKTS
jgi:hypothetical protein